MSYKNDTIQTYMNQIDNGPLLTRKQEEDLIKNIEVYQKEIVQAFTKSAYARNELKTYLESLDSSGESMTDISKKLDDDSTGEVVASFKVKFDALVKSLSGTDSDAISALIDDVALSGTIVHSVVTQIKKKHAAIIDAEGQVKQIVKYVPTLSLMEVVSKIESSQNDLEYVLRNDFGLTDVKTQNKMNEWKSYVANLRLVESTLGKSTSFDDVKSTYASISKYEMMASKFKNELIERNLRLVVSRAKAFVNRGLDFEDLIQEGNIGLMKAIDKFDSSKKTKVSTYATWWIDQSIRRAISNKAKTVRIPTHIEWMQMKLAEASKKLYSELQRQPTIAELSAKTGYEVKAIEENMTRAQYEIGLEEELSSGMTMIDMLQSDAESPHTSVEKTLLREKVRDILATLNPRTEKIIRLRFGIGEEPDAEGRTLQAVADQIGITKQGVRVVECGAFKALRKKARTLQGE